MEKHKVGNKNLITAAMIIIVGAACFYVGISYGKQGAAGAQQQTFQQFRGQRAGGNGGGGQQSAAGLVSGQVLSKDGQSITVQTRDGSSHIVFYSSSTPVTKPISGSVSDISAGTQVMVGGTQNSDGSLTAQSIQVREGMQGQRQNQVRGQ
jgi:hypothetical protein